MSKLQKSRFNELLELAAEAAGEDVTTVVDNWDQQRAIYVAGRGTQYSDCFSARSYSQVMTFSFPWETAVMGKHYWGGIFRELRWMEE